MTYALEAFEVFEKIVKLGSLSAAARALGIRKDSVGARLKTLEKNLGVTLLHRTTRSIRLTEEGRHYLQWYSKAAEGLEATQRTLQGKPSAIAPAPKETPTTTPMPRFDIVVRQLGEMQWAATCRPFELIVVGQDLREVLQKIGVAIVAEQNKPEERNES